MLSAHQMHTRLGFSVSLALLLLACAPAMQSSGLQDVSTELPGGFTIWPAEGEWRGPGERPSREPSFVLEVVHPPRSVGTDSAIVAIIAEYKRRFGQESVLRVITAGRASY